MDNTPWYKKVYNWFINQLGAKPDSTGINFGVLVLAAFLTIALYFVCNSCLYLWINSVSHATLSGVEKNDSEVQSEKQLAKDYIRAFEADAKLQPWVEKHIRPAQTYSEQITSLVTSIQSSATENEQETKKITQKLNKLLCGSPSGWVFVSAYKYSGTEVLNQITDKTWYDALERDSLGESKKEFLVKFINQVMQIYDTPLRIIFRINGWIQYLLVFGFMTIAIVLVQRYRMLCKCVENTLESMELQSQLPTLKEAEESVYRPISSMIAILPSMGFIGTVLGMGEALLKADKLFSAQDKQMVMAELTQKLGFAFDTTYVALVLALLLELAFIWVRTFETHISKVDESE